MSDGLWRDDLKCGCRKGGGHVCRPSWVTPEEWRDHVESESKDGPGESLGQGLVTPGLTTRYKLEALMDSTQPAAVRYPPNGGR